MKVSEFQVKSVKILLEPIEVFGFQNEYKSNILLLS